MWLGSWNSKNELHWQRQIKFNIHSTFIYTNYEKYCTPLISFYEFSPFCFSCWLGCCLIPCCIPECQDIEHRCPNCKAHLGTFRRLWTNQSLICVWEVCIVLSVHSTYSFLMRNMFLVEYNLFWSLEIIYTFPIFGESIFTI